MTNAKNRETYLPSIIDCLEDSPTPMSVDHIVRTLYEVEHRTLAPLECAKLMRAAAAAGRVKLAPYSDPANPTYVAVKRLFPETGHPLEGIIRPVASVWELGCLEPPRWGHKEPKEPPEPLDQPTRREPAQERPTWPTV